MYTLSPVKSCWNTAYRINQTSFEDVIHDFCIVSRHESHCESLTDTHLRVRFTSVFFTGFWLLCSILKYHVFISIYFIYQITVEGECSCNIFYIIYKNICSFIYWVIPGRTFLKGWYMIKENLLRSLSAWNTLLPQLCLWDRCNM